MANKIICNWGRVPIIFDLDYAACIAGSTKGNLKYLAQNKRFPAFKVGRLWRVKKEDLMAWIEQQKSEQAS